MKILIKFLDILSDLDNSRDTLIGKFILYSEFLFTKKSNIGWVDGTAIPTGWIIFILMIILEFFSIPFFRKRGYFQVRAFIISRRTFMW